VRARRERRARVRDGRFARQRFERGRLEQNVAARRRQPLSDVPRRRRDARPDCARQKLSAREAFRRDEQARAPRRHARDTPPDAELLAHLFALLQEQARERAPDVAEAEQTEVENFHVDFPHVLRDALRRSEQARLRCMRRAPGRSSNFYQAKRDQTQWRENSDAKARA
jgi:hypothetical protein